MFSNLRTADYKALVAIMLVFADTVTPSLASMEMVSATPSANNTYSLLFLLSPPFPSFLSPPSSPCPLLLVHTSLSSSASIRPFFFCVECSCDSCDWMLVCLSLLRYVSDHLSFVPSVRLSFLSFVVRCSAMFCHLTQRYESTKGEKAPSFFHVLLSLV